MYDDIDNLEQQQNSLLQQQEQKQNDMINQQTQMQVDELNREKTKLEKETDKTNQGLYTNYLKQSNQYGAGMEQLAQNGLGNSGYAESTKTALYNNYQKSVTDTLNNSNNLYADYNFKIQQARQNGSIQQAQSALDLYSQKLNLLVQNYQLRQDKEKFLYQKQRDQISDDQWQKSFDEQVRQNELENEWKQKQFDYQKERDQVQDNQWLQQFNLSKKKSSVSSSKRKSTKSKSKKSKTPIDDGGNNGVNTNGNINYTLANSAIYPVASAMVGGQGMGRTDPAEFANYMNNLVENNKLTQEQVMKLLR